MLARLQINKNVGPNLALRAGNIVKIKLKLSNQMKENERKTEWKWAWRQNENVKFGKCK